MFASMAAECVDTSRNVLRATKAGHCGTLDRAAEGAWEMCGDTDQMHCCVLDRHGGVWPGVLPIAVGGATRFIQVRACVSACVRVWFGDSKKKDTVQRAEMKAYCILSCVCSPRTRLGWLTCVVSLSQYLDNSKEYHTTIRFGIRTTSDDLTG